MTPFRTCHPGFRSASVVELVCVTRIRVLDRDITPIKCVCVKGENARTHFARPHATPGMSAARTAATAGPALNARRTSARQQMVFTRALITFMRRATDACNVVIYWVQRPMRKLVNIWSQESTVFYVCFGTVFGSWLPYVLYPYTQDALDPDMRQKKEEERIRVNLQKGADPLPTMMDKTNLRGQHVALYVTDDTTIKLSIDSDWRSMERFRQGRQEELDAQMRREQEWIRLEEEHRKAQFGVFAHNERFAHIDRYRTGRPNVAWAPSDPKQTPMPGIVPGQRMFPEDK
jgi:hypothetical protein